MIRNLTLIFAYVVCVTIAQILMKMGMNQLAGLHVDVQFFKAVVSSPKAVSGVFLYAVAFIIWLIVLSRMELTFAYPLLSLSVVFVAIISWIFMEETFNISRLFGMFLTILGAWLVVRS